MHRYILGMIMLAGCSPQAPELRYQSTLMAKTNGVAMSEDGLSSFAAMSGTTCSIDTRWGCVTGDEDLPTTDERVLDHHDGITLASTVEGLHLMSTEGWVENNQIERVIRNARLTQHGAISLSGDEAGCFVDSDGRSTEVPSGLCHADAAVDVDRDGSMVVGSISGVYGVDESGAEKLAEAGDLVAFDSALGQIYIAASGESWLRAMSRSGSELWNVETSGPVKAIATRGERGEVVVLTETPEGMGELSVYEGGTGAARATPTVPQSDGDLIVSENGFTVGVVHEDRVHYYELIELGDSRPVATDKPQCSGIDVGWVAD